MKSIFFDGLQKHLKLIIVLMGESALMFLNSLSKLLSSQGEEGIKFIELPAHLRDTHDLNYTMFK